MKYLFLFKFIVYSICSFYSQNNIYSINFEFSESNDFITLKALPAKF